MTIYYGPPTLPKEEPTEPNLPMLHIPCPACKGSGHMLNQFDTGPSLTRCWHCEGMGIIAPQPLKEVAQ